MEPSFQTSFMPKKPMVENRAIGSQSLSFLSVVGMFLLFSVLLITVGLYFYRGILTKNISTMENNLNLAKNRFEPAKIAELKVLDRRLHAASEILSKHIAVTPIFELLQSITMKTIRYTKFSYSVGDEKNPSIYVKMNGVAVGYSSVALQSDLFTKNKNLIDPVFSNLVLDDKGNVMFDLEFSVDPTFVDYKQVLLTKGEEANLP